MSDAVIKEAQKRLRKDSFDAGHDYDHHLAVVNNCLAIIAEEKLDVDLNALLIAAWWHDYKRNDTRKNDLILTAVMKKHKMPEDFIKKVLFIKNSHSFGQGQQSIEQKILFDADKLEYVSANRYRKVSDAVKRGEMSKETQEKYKNVFQDRIQSVVVGLHFESSKKNIQARIVDLITYVEVEPIWSDLALTLSHLVL